jgi:ParB-like chromosome segregation protein Spo0J
MSKMKLKDINPNPNNPRLVKDDRFRKLVASIEQFPEMMELRPMIVDENNVILGGNMRYKALKELKRKEIPDSWVKRADELTDDQKRQFIIKDNVGFGEHDWDILANEWDSELLNEWGLDVWQAPKDVNLDEFFEEDTSEPAEPKNKIVLEYSEEEYEQIVAKFDSMDGSKENIVWKLLGL